ncbi:flagellar hook-basal body complex protein FliE [Aliikangiella sp. IMCC44653]
MKTGLDQNAMLAQMHKLSQLAKSGGAQASQNINPANAAQPTDFTQVLSGAINKVNQYQQESAQAATQIETGDGGASLVKAVIASQKASVAFQATLQVRNKVVNAYQDIMNMPI